MLLLVQGGWGTNGAFYAEDRFGPGSTPLFVHGITCRGTEALVQVGEAGRAWVLLPCRYMNCMGT